MNVFFPCITKIYHMWYLKDNNGFSFHTIVLLVDRIKLDEQVGEVVERFLNNNGIDEVSRADTVEHLVSIFKNQKSANKQVIITTTQKFCYLSKNDVMLTNLSLLTEEKKSSNQQNGLCRIAIIIDEAHRSHRHETREMLNKVLENAQNKETYCTVGSVISCLLIK